METLEEWQNREQHNPRKPCTRIKGLKVPKCSKRVGIKSPLARRPLTALIMKHPCDPIHPDASTQQKYKAPISFCHLACQMCHLASLFFFAKKFLQIVCTSNMSKILAPKSSLVRYSSSLTTYDSDCKKA